MGLTYHSAQICVCAQPVRVRVCWSAGTVSAFLRRFVVMERTTVKTAAMRSTAAKSRVRPLSSSGPSLFIHPTRTSLIFTCVCVFQLRVCVFPVSPAVSPLPVRRCAQGATPPATPETTTTAVSPQCDLPVTPTQTSQSDTQV